MHVRTMILLLVPSLCLAYNPSAEEILSRMETMLRRSDPVALQVVRKTPDGSQQSEYRIRIPSETFEETAVDGDFLFPFSVFTLPKVQLLGSLESLSDGYASVKLDRLGGSICYLLEGRSEKIWLRKHDFLPLKVESLSHFGERMTYTYLDPVNVSGKTRYPSRTEVQRDGSLVLIEQLIPARAATVKP